MSLSQLRVKLLVAAGVAGASLLGATFVGCQSGPPSQMSNAQMTNGNGQMPNGPFANGQPGTSPFAQYAGAPNGQPAGPLGAAQYGAPQQLTGQQFPGQQFPGQQLAGGQPNGQQMTAQPSGAFQQTAYSSGAANGWSQQSRQSFLNETQRLGTQQNLTAQDVIAMSRSGMPDQQIAMAIDQRGANLRTNPNISSYLAQNGVNPAVLSTPAPAQSGGSSSGALSGSSAGLNGAQTAMNDVAVGSPFGPAAGGGSARSTMNRSLPSTTFGGVPSDSAAVQPANFESSQSTPVFDSTASSAAAASAGQSWRAMPR